MTDYPTGHGIALLLQDTSGITESSETPSEPKPGGVPPDLISVSLWQGMNSACWGRKISKKLRGGGGGEGGWER